MDAKTYVKKQIASARRTADGVLEGLTDEQVNWAPPGTANAIGVTLVHMLTSEDAFVQAVLQGKPLVWASGGWAGRIGISAPPGRGAGWDEVKSARLSAATLKEYRQAVQAATDAYLGRLTDEDLDCEVTMMGGTRQVADALTMVAAHTLEHSGEIAALKGVQGSKGLPY